ncbi:MAG: hypothetical protein NTW21_38735 [Verrucomicrobia bacterium]|nr:hypothetical protein [Verrucomicrobiota bacterium]
MKLGSKNVSAPSGTVWGLAAAGLVTAACGLAALAGWLLECPQLTSLGAGLMPMAPSTALLFVGFGLAVCWRARAPLIDRAFGIGMVVGWLGVLVALPLGVLAGLKIHWQGEHLGLNLTGMVQGAAIGHMSVVTACCFLLASGSFLASLSRGKIRYRRAVLAAGSAGVLLTACLIFLLAYLLGAPLLYGGAFIPPALGTLLAFCVLGLALMVMAVRDGGLVGEGPAEAFGAAFHFILIFVILAAGIVTAGYTHYRNYENQFRAQLERQLATIADLKVGELVQWREDRLSDAVIFFKNPSFTAMVRRFLEQAADADAQGQLHDWLDKYPMIEDYNRVRLMDAQGITRLSLPADPEPSCPETLQSATAALRSGQIVIQDFHRHSNTQSIYLAVLVPILDESNANRPLGVLVLRIDPAKYLYPFIQRWPTPSLSAETLLLRRDGNDVLFLSTANFKTNAALNLRIPLDKSDLAVVKAALRQEGVVEGLDYCGCRTLAALRVVPDSPWVMVARIEAAEGYAPLRVQLWQMVALTGALILGAATAVSLVWRQQRLRFYQAQAAAAEALRNETRNLEAILEASPVAMFILDEATNIVRANTAAVVLSAGSGAADVLHHRPGKALGCVHSSMDPRGCGYSAQCPLCPARNGIDALIASGGAMHGSELMLELIRNGEPRMVWIRIDAASLMLDGHRHWCVAMQDITKRQQAEADIRQQLDELRRWQTVMLGSADRSMQLKGEVNGLLRRLGEPIRYPSQESEQ